MRGERGERTPGVSVNTFLRSYHSVSVNTILGRSYHGHYQYCIDIKLVHRGCNAKAKKCMYVILQRFKILFNMSPCNTAWEEKYPTNPLVCNKKSDMCLAYPGWSQGVLC